jgi:cytidylate kinase
LITIDGPAGSGKSTVSQLLAKQLSYCCLDTGALYRAVAYQVLKKRLDGADQETIMDLCGRTDIRLKRLGDVLKVFVEGRDVSDKIRTEAVGLLASSLSALPAVRSALLPVQREAAKHGGMIAEGRDMGTVVFPDADVKFFLDADAEVRARRRWLELAMRGEQVSFTLLMEGMMIRDRQDRERAIAPLKVPANAIMIDSTGLDIDAVVRAMLSAIPEP